MGEGELATTRRIVLVCVLVGAHLFAAAPAQAATITVNTPVDTLTDADGLCSLREAIINANANATTWTNCAAGTGDDTITVPAGTFNLTLGGDDDVAALGDLDTTGNLTIQGAGQGSTTIDLLAISDRAFHVLSGSLTLRDMTLANGNPDDGLDSGGAVFLEETDLTVTSVTFADNVVVGSPGGFFTVGAGGAIGTSGLSTILISDSEFFGNEADADFSSGGAIDAFDSNLTIIDSTFTNNMTSGFGEGGAVFVCDCGFLPTVSITGSTFTGNSAITGGAIFLDSVPDASIVSSTFTANSAFGGGAIFFDSVPDASVASSTFDQNLALEGGGIWLAGTSLELSESTFTDNGADTLGGALSAAFGLVSNVLDIENSTFSGNGADIGGAIATDDTSGSVRHVTVTRSTSFSGAAIEEATPGSLDFSNSLIVDQDIGPDCAAALGDFGGNFDSDGSCDVTGTAGPLPDLADNGGPTMTHALPSGYPAVDGGVPAGCAGLSTDQRGVGRPQGGGCDSGAYEFVPPPSPVYRTLTVDRSDGGHVGGAFNIDCGTQCSRQVIDGTFGKLMAAPDAGFTFSGWSGCDRVVSDECWVTMSSDRTIGATFAPEVEPSPSPTVSPSPDPEPELVESGPCKGFEVDSETVLPSGVVIVGTMGPDNLVGGSGADLICGLEGNDTLRGGRGGDRLAGGAGDDLLQGGRGPDELNGGAGTDDCSLGRGGSTMKKCEGSKQT